MLKIILENDVAAKTFWSRLLGFVGILMAMFLDLKKTFIPATYLLSGGILASATRVAMKSIKPTEVVSMRLFIFGRL